jgi:hypothetical protein
MLDFEAAQDKQGIEDVKFQEAANRVLTQHADLLEKLAQ